MNAQSQFNAKFFFKQQNLRLFKKKKKTQNTDTTYVELLIHYSWTHLHNLVISFSYLEKIKQTNKNHKPMFLSSQSL